MIKSTKNELSIYIDETARFEVLCANQTRIRTYFESLIKIYSIMHVVFVYLCTVIEKFENIKIKVQTTTTRMHGIVVHID